MATLESRVQLLEGILYETIQSQLLMTEMLIELNALRAEFEEDEAARRATLTSGTLLHGGISRLRSTLDRLAGMQGTGYFREQP